MNQIEELKQEIIQELRECSTIEGMDFVINYFHKKFHGTLTEEEVRAWEYEQYFRADQKLPLEERALKY